MPRRLARGEPPDAPGRCNARLDLGYHTRLCGLPESHEGRHEEMSNRRGHSVIITWDGSDEPEYDDCCCDCGFEGTENWGPLYGCCHKFSTDGECTECGIPMAEHDRIAEERRKE